MKILRTPFLVVIFLSWAMLVRAAEGPKALPSPDGRYKADILVVLAHPDDEAGATSYLARALDEGKRVAVVFTTRGSNGANSAGEEQAAALGDIREIEARRALANFGIANVWFLSGKDTPSQNVLQSLANWGHGACLEQLVRMVRLTRAEVILTVLPGTFIGEDHGDHQAAGVLATEAFDLAGDPTAFPEQLSGPTQRLETYLENLRPWQPKKIYYSPDADREDIFRGLGPTYSGKDVSRTTHKSYGRMALEGFRTHETQAKGYLDRIGGMEDAQIQKLAESDGWEGPQQLVRGKSSVGGSVTGDIFEGVTVGAIPFVRPELSPEPAHPELSMELGGPWSFYADFRRLHGLAHLPHPEPPEIALQAPGTLVIPLWLRNQSPKPQEIAISVSLPAGWTLQNDGEKFSVAPKQVAAARLEVNLPAIAVASQKRQDAQEITVRAECNGQNIGTVKLRIELRKRALPQ
jgi:LmbE family N-acetylglucosaminyl deacetylase